MSYDVVVIGSGPGGYVAAIRCAQLGLKTALVEKYPTFGGTCLNVGCIPSKALLDASEHYENASKHMADFGVQVGDLSIDWEKMKGRKDQVVRDTCNGLEFLMKKNKIETHQGIGSFLDANTIQVKEEKGTIHKLETKHTIIATGSKPTALPFAAFDGKRIVSSTEALKFPKIPKEMVVIGGGVIGLELGSVYARLGTQVKVVEYMDALIPTMDRSLGKELQRVLKKQGMEFHLSHKVTEVRNTGRKVSVKAENKKGEAVEFKGDYCLVSVGRSPFTDSLGLENAGIQPDKRGFIPVDGDLQTTTKGIWAIGDVVGGAMLAHKAEEEGTAVAERIAGQKPHLNYRAIPGVVYTWPEVAGVGYTEEELKEEKRAYKSGQFAYRALGRARAAGEMDGFVKVLADQETDEILGVHMLGARVADMIIEGVVALEYKASAEDLARMSHAHPTFTEAVKEAALAATDKRPIHA